MSATLPRHMPARAATLGVLELELSVPRVADHPQLRGRRRRELERLIEDTRAYVHRSVRPRALELDRLAADDPGRFPWDLVREGSDLGLLNLIVPRPSGGDADRFCLRASLVAEELAAGCAGMATLFGVHALGITPLLLAGPAVWDGELRSLGHGLDEDGRPLIMALAITEPSAGTDVEHHEYVKTAKLVCRAEEVPGGYRIYGVKHFISNGNVARWVSVVMPVDPRRPYETTAGFLVDTRTEGFAVTKVEHKMGQRASPAAELTFDGVFVPHARVLGRPGDGVAMIAGALAASRPFVGAIGTGIARGAYERLLDWLTNDPAAAGLLERQQVQLALAQMWEDVHLSRQAYLDAATVFDTQGLGSLFAKPAVRMFGAMPPATRSNPVAQRGLQSEWSRRGMIRLMERQVGDSMLARGLGVSSMAKAHGGDVAMRVAGHALEIAGLDCGELRPELEKCLRDAKLVQIYEGTNQLNRLEAFETLVAGRSMGVLSEAAARRGRNGGLQ